MNRLKLIFHRLCILLNNKTVLFLAALSLVLNCFLEILGRQSAVSLITYMAARPHIFILNSAVIMLSFTVIFFVKRKAFGVLMLSVFWMLCGITNTALMAFRASPFTARDILLVGYGLRIADVYLSKPMIVLISAGLAVFAAGAVFAFIKLPKRTEKARTQRLAGLLLACAIVVVMVTNASAGYLDIPDEYDNILDAYDDYGFAYCFANSILSFGINKPADYSEEAVHDVISRLHGEKAPENPDVNVVFVQLESFFDPALITGLGLSDNPVPVFSGLKERFPSGYLNVPSVGGGTANTEFEVLTGMTLNHFGMGEYPYESVLRERACDSVAYNLKKLGYTAHAVHNHSGSFYSRNIVYSNLGFDRFVPLEYMRDVRFTRTGWAKDAVLTDYITDCLDQSPGPDFVFAVTVQAHGKYPSDFDNMPFDIDEHEMFSQLDAGAFEYFLKQLNETDVFVGKLVEKLSGFDEKTVVVLYGDHLPPLPVPEEQLESGSRYKTEYIIWSNFGLETEDKDISSNELSAYVLGLLDINSGLLMRLHQTYQDQANKDAALATLEYDMLYGERYSNGGEEYRPTELKMGISEAYIDMVYADKLRAYVSGANFTPFSAIYVNGERKETVFITDGLLRSPEIFEEGDIITVCQTGPDRIVLSSTESFVYTRSQ